MKNKRTQSTFGQVYQSKVFVYVISGVLLFMIVGFVNGILQDYKVDQEIRQYEKDIAGLQKKRLESMEILDYVSSDAFVEEKARTALQMKKPKERVVYVHRNKDVEISESRKGYDVIQKNTLRQVANPTKWWYYFTHKEL